MSSGRRQRTEEHRRAKSLDMACYKDTSTKEEEFRHV